MQITVADEHGNTFPLQFEQGFTVDLITWIAERDLKVVKVRAGCATSESRK